MDPFEDRIHLLTPEMVPIELPLAGLGSRGLAYLTDASLRYGIPLVLLALLVGFVPTFADLFNYFQRHPYVGVVGVVGFFVSQYLYYVLFETFWSGQTPGKRLMGLRVVQTGGTPVTFLTSAVRNFLRVVDSRPLFYGLGVFLVFLTGRRQRLGDLAAGTLVVREGQSMKMGKDTVGVRVGPEWASGLGLRLDPEEWDRVRRFVSRAEEMDDAVRRALARRILEALLRVRGRESSEAWRRIPPPMAALRQLVQGSLQQEAAEEDAP
jgi:uncharacterized RDD family membrane protein YckC